MGESAEPFGDGTDFAVEHDRVDSPAGHHVRLLEGMTMQDDTLQVGGDRRGSNMFESKSDSALSRRNPGSVKSNCSTGNISSAVTFEGDKSIADNPNARLQACQLSSSESRLSYDEESLRSSHSRCTSASLPAIPSLDSYSVRNRADASGKDAPAQGNVATACTDEEETLFNRSTELKNPLSESECSVNKKTTETCRRDSTEDEQETNCLEGRIAESGVSEAKRFCEETPDSRLRTNGGMNERGQVVDVCKRNSTPTLGIHARGSATRPTLADDSKLVKMSLLANPMNIMQSNVQLLNKSRNFLDFITEKSTNIMEKVLLPQHLAIIHTIKSMETDAAGFGTDNVAFRLNAGFATNRINTTDCAVRQNHDRSEDNSGSVTRKNEKEADACTKKNETYDDSEGRLLYNNNLENETVSGKKKYHALTNNDFNRLDCDVIDDERDVSSAGTGEDKSCLQTDELYDDACKEDSSDIDALADSSNLKYGSSEHSSYLALLKDYGSLKLEHSKLLERMEYLKKLSRPSSCQETEAGANTLILQVENLEKTVNKLTADLNTSLDTQEALKKECAAVSKEKENMVMRYVTSEKQLIDTQRARDSTERKVKELQKDQELLQGKLRQAQGERARICNILDGKCREVSDLQKEIENLKEDVKLKEIKLKWTQTKLKTEMESQKDTQQKLDKSLMKINDMKEECEQIRRETQESFRKFQQSEENKAVTLDQQLKEHQARLILERHVTEDKETLRLQLQKELEALKSKQQNLIEENKKLSLTVQESEKVRLDNENDLSDLRFVADQRQQRITELLNKVSEFETLKLQLQHKEEYVVSTEAKLLQLQSTNEELQSDMQSCRQKEANMLDFTQKLTDKNVRLQSEFIAIHTKTNHLEAEQGPLRECINELTGRVKTLEGDLTQERKKRREECEILAKHVAEQTQLAQNFAQKLEDSQGENAVLKRKHQASIKEMTRELQQCRKKLETFETTSPSNSLDIASRTGSNTSLAGDTSNGALSDNNANSEHINSIELNKQVLVDRIIKLQNINAKRAEKLDFLKGHTQMLLEDIQKKDKIIQNYILHQNFGALACNERDRYKAELARRGGIMASVYNHRVSDENMTLELSLEINQKLQAVLEDALLKNITLKDNIDTLGKEIAKLTMEHQQKQIDN
ncbi:PREDICTED: coiled-coil domain-containing protein 186-like isoform X2 [Vollenhovia emeryi]|uniref:coiled-coil domain-containing protein 186-like isoform X2 n=1 Tax=Vollenhovia emeryi TaxID=411798 RepID=UPI0005F56849|nr:PREDICTED: coiled-coil domain-containing protein 186-like isoform X2 [Vollenhovia emeryi]